MQSGHASACRRGHSHVPSSLLLATRPSEPANAMRTGERETGSSGEARGDVRMPALAALRVALSGGRHLVQRLPGEIADRSQLQLRSAPLQTRYIVVAYVRNGELIRDDRRARPRTRRPKIEFRYAYRIRHAYPGIVHMILRRSLYKLVQCLSALRRFVTRAHPLSAGHVAEKGRHRSHRWLMTHHTTVATAHWEALPFAATVTVRGASSLTASPCGATVTSFGGRGISSIGGKRIGHS